MRQAIVARRSRRESARPSTADLGEMIEQLRDALLGLAEREIPGDPVPCFCVRYEPESGVHDEWCEVARIALADTSDITPRLDSATNVASGG